MPGNGRDFNCSWEHCRKSFNRKSDLCRHYRIHTNERPYHCDFRGCRKSFIQRSALTVHSRTHTGEKPHVCDQVSCRKAFSDSSSLARHRRIHTGKRPYICREPACDRSFCRKTTLTKHQHRTHPPGGSRPPSEDGASSDQSFATPVSTSVPNDQYLLSPQAYYPHSSTPTHEFYPQQNLPMSPVAVQEVPLPPPVSVQQAQQHYLQQLMQQRYDQSRQSYEYQQHFASVPAIEAPPLMVTTYPQTFEYKPQQQARLLNQPEGTDWGFLGVG